MLAFTAAQRARRDATQAKPSSSVGAAPRDPGQARAAAEDAAFRAMPSATRPEAAPTGVGRSGRGGRTPRESGLKRDDDVLAVLRGAVMQKDESARAAVLDWVKRIEGRIEGGAPFTVLEHTAFAFLLSSDFFAAPANAAERSPGAEVRPTLERALQASWQHLAGEVPDDPLTRLPKRVLRGADRRARLYHAASFLPIGDRKAQMEASRLFRDFVPENQDMFVFGATLLAGAFSSTACQVIGSAILSYAVVGLSESFQHNHLAHPRKGTLGAWVLTGPRKDAGWIERGVHTVVAKLLKKQLAFTRTSHAMVHHGMTFRESYTQMFDSPEHKAQVDAFVNELGEDDAKQIFGELYGSTLNARGLKAIMGSIAPQTAALITAGMMFGASAWAYVPLILIAGIYPFTMKQVHPFLHANEHEAREAAGPIMQKILDSRWAAWACRNHWLHHKAPANYNLSFPGADALLGTLMQPNLQDLFEMAEEGTLHY